MTGEGIWADLIRQRFTKARSASGSTNGARGMLDMSQFRLAELLRRSRPRADDAQLDLF